MDGAFVPKGKHGINHIKHNIEYGFQLVGIIQSKRKNMFLIKIISKFNFNNYRNFYITMTDRIKAKDKINNILGICCYHLLPIKQEYYIGKGKIIGICTLSSLDLLKEIKNNQEIMNKISIVGRLLSENKGLDEIIKFTINNKSLKYLLLCGEEVKGHLSGQTLIALNRNGIDQNKKSYKYCCTLSIFGMFI